jgi:molybdopterin adenylyltransferase
VPTDRAQNVQHFPATVGCAFVDARVLKGCVLQPGMPVELVHKVACSTIQAAVITVSDRCAVGTTVGPAVAVLLNSELNARIAWTRVVPYEADKIAAELKDLCDRRVDLIITVGGTGISLRDVTPEATRTVIDCELPGLGEAMRVASAQKPPNAWLSRVIAGVRRETLILNLPGSLKVATENLHAVLPALPHAVKMLRGETVYPEQDKERLISINSHLQRSHGLGCCTVSMNDWLQNLCRVLRDRLR